MKILQKTFWSGQKNLNFKRPLKWKFWEKKEKFVDFDYQMIITSNFVAVWYKYPQKRFFWKINVFNSMFIHSEYLPIFDLDSFIAPLIITLSKCF